MEQSTIGVIVAVLLVVGVAFALTRDKKKGKGQLPPKDDDQQEP